MAATQWLSLTAKLGDEGRRGGEGCPDMGGVALSGRALRTAHTSIKVWRKRRAVRLEPGD